MGFSGMNNLEKASFFGLNVTIYDLNELRLYISRTIEHGMSKIFYGYGLGVIPMMQKHPEIVKLGNNADLLVTDGRVFYLLCKLFKLPLKYDLSIPQLVYLLLRMANKNGWGVYLLGAEKEFNQVARENVKNNYPNVKFCKGRDGFFDGKEIDDILRDINSCKPEILLIGISSPQKEILAELFREKGLGNVIVPCGGMIDVLANKTAITPTIIKKLGGASMFRLIQEPGRLHRRLLYIYSFSLFNLLPVLIWNVLILRDKKFSITRYYGIAT